MESNARYNLLAKVEETRDYLKRLTDWNSDFGNDKLSEEIFKYRNALEFIDKYAQQSNENKSLDMENFNKVFDEVVKELDNLSETEKIIHTNNAETMILDKVLLAESLYFENKTEDNFFSRVEKISNTCKQLDVGNLKKLSAYLDKQYLKNFPHTDEKLKDDYSASKLDKTSKDKTKEIIEETKTLAGKITVFKQESQSILQEERYNELLQLMNAVNEEFNSIGTQKKYDDNVLHNLKQKAEGLVTQKINGEINLEDAQKQRDQLIWEMEQFKENVVKAKNEILISETIANVNKTKTQLAAMKEMGINVELIELYSAFTNAHLDNLQNAAEQMHYLNKEELLQEIGNIKTENKAFQQEVEQQRNQEQ